MNTIKRFFLSRVTILWFIGLALATITLAALIPQSFITPAAELEKWRLAHPLLSHWSTLLRLNRMYTHPFFAVIMSGVVISLSFSAWDQFRGAWRRTCGQRALGAATHLHTTAEFEEVIRIFRSHRYISLGGDGVSKGFVRSPWGFWGNFLLHFGLVVTIASSLLIALTQQRAILSLGQGQTQQPGMPWTAHEEGLLVGPLDLPAAVRLDRLNYSFWPTYGVKDVASTITFMPADSPSETVTVPINSILRYRGLRIYQGIEFGHAFYVEMISPEGRREVVQLLMQHQDTPEKPSYNDFSDLMGAGRMLRAKYFADAEGKSFERIDPLLVLRVDEGGKEIGRLSLRRGSEGDIGGYHFRLVTYGLWSRLILVKLTGIPGVFFGFFIICLGGLLHYFTPPREALIKPITGGGTEVFWQATKFADFYSDEFEEIKRSLNAEEMHG